MQVIIRNFQSIEEVKLNVKGFTLLVGESSQGKSATFRALQAAITNRFRAGQVRNGMPKAEVLVKYDNDSPVLQVVKPANGSASMKLGDQTFVKLSRTVPAQIAQLSNMEAVSSDASSYSLNFHPQFEKPLLLEFSQRKVMELLSASQAIDELNICKDALSVKKAETRGAFTSIDSILTNLKTSKSDLTTRIEKFQPSVDELKSCWARLKELEKMASTLDEVSKKMASNEALNKKHELMTDLIGLVASNPSADLHTIEEITSLDKAQETLLSRKAQLASFIPIVETIVETRTYSLRIDSALSTVQSLMSTDELLQSQYSRRIDLDNVVNNHICPICGNIIDENHEH